MGNSPCRSNNPIPVCFFSTHIFLMPFSTSSLMAHQRTWIFHNFPVMQFSKSNDFRQLHAHSHKFIKFPYSENHLLENSEKVFPLFSKALTTFCPLVIKYLLVFTFICKIFAGYHLQQIGHQFLKYMWW